MIWIEFLIIIIFILIILKPQKAFLKAFLVPTHAFVEAYFGLIS